MLDATQHTELCLSCEANFDGIVGPTHNYAGLSYGNVASASNQGRVSSPRRAALQGLAKMEAVAALGVLQGVLPPHERPHLPTLRGLGVPEEHGSTDEAVLARVARMDPVLLARVSSASAMWTANAATVIPAIDARDQRTHFITANLREMFHRAIEPPVTARALRATFQDRERFEVFDAFPTDSREDFGDEGAANHTRFTTSTQNGGDVVGMHLFVYGASRDAARKPEKFPARQTLSASMRVAQLGFLSPQRTIYAQQNADAIDAGVFHNDVIAVGNGNLLLTHELAFEDREGTYAALTNTVGDSLVIAEVGADELGLEEVVKSYLFNSQLLTLPDGTMALVCPSECAERPRVKAVIDRLIADPHIPLSRAIFLDVRESMRNGGGPACLRLRVPLAAQDVARVNPQAFATPSKLAELRAWVERHYRDELAATDLADPALLRESRDALDELTRILDLGSIYDFQRA
jgi:succinylarginine dihydrolase